MDQFIYLTVTHFKTREEYKQEEGGDKEKPMSEGGDINYYHKNIIRHYLELLDENDQVIGEVTFRKKEIVTGMGVYSDFSGIHYYKKDIIPLLHKRGLKDGLVQKVRTELTKAANKDNSPLVWRMNKQLTWEKS